MGNLINTVANHPEVLEGCAPGYASVDVSHFADNPRNKYFGDESGVILLAHVGYGVYEWHYLLTYDCRGKAALALARRALETMFTVHEASVIVGSTPRVNRAARLMNRALGAVPIGESEDSQGRPCIDYRLDRDRWATFSKG